MIVSNKKVDISIEYFNVKNKSMEYIDVVANNVSEVNDIIKTNIDLISKKGFITKVKCSKAIKPVKNDDVTKASNILKLVPLIMSPVDFHLSVKEDYNNFFAVGKIKNIQINKYEEVSIDLLLLNRELRVISDKLILNIKIEDGLKKAFLENVEEGEIIKVDGFLNLKTFLLEIDGLTKVNDN